MNENPLFKGSLGQWNRIEVEELADDDPRVIQRRKDNDLMNSGLNKLLGGMPITDEERAELEKWNLI